MSPPPNQPRLTASARSPITTPPSQTERLSSASWGGYVGPDRVPARDPPHRAFGADAVRGLGGHVGRDPQPLPARRPDGQFGPAPPAAGGPWTIAWTSSRPASTTTPRPPGCWAPPAWRSIASATGSTTIASCAKSCARPWRRSLARTTSTLAAWLGSPTPRTPPTGAWSCPSWSSVRTPRQRLRPLCVPASTAV